MQKERKIKNKNLQKEHKLRIKKRRKTGNREKDDETVRIKKNKMVKMSVE